jgi:hypothetical protein
MLKFNFNLSRKFFALLDQFMFYRLSIFLPLQSYLRRLKQVIANIGPQGLQTGSISDFLVSAL